MNKRNPDRTARGGFTLVELLVVMGIIGILVGLLLPAITQAVTASRVAATQHTIMGLGGAIDAFKKDWGFYPPSDNVHEVKLGYPRYGYECMVYYLLGPDQKGWGLNYTTTANPSGIAPFGGTATKPYPPYFNPDKSGDIMIVDTDDYRNIVPKNSITTSLSIQDAFNPAKRILYLRFDLSSSSPYNAFSGADIKSEDPNDTSHKAVLGLVRGSSDLSCVASFASQGHFELLARPRGRWVRQDYLLISCGADRYWGWVKQAVATTGGGGYTGRMAPATPSSDPGVSTDADIFCDDICNFSY
jgi:prepilin-type N-terminal cleavage/methylation domain-containing protein